MPQESRKRNRDPVVSLISPDHRTDAALLKLPPRDMSVSAPLPCSLLTGERAVLLFVKVAYVRVFTSIRGGGSEAPQSCFIYVFFIYFALSNSITVSVGVLTEGC